MCDILRIKPFEDCLYWTLRRLTAGDIQLFIINSYTATFVIVIVILMVCRWGWGKGQNTLDTILLGGRYLKGMHCKMESD